MASESVRLLGDLVESLDVIHTAKLTHPQRPPEQVAYLFELKRLLREGRVIVPFYNYALLVLLAVLTALHLWEKRRCRRQWDRKKHRDATRVCIQFDAQGGSDRSSVTSSSSSNSPQNTTPSGALKDVHIDLERLPLLAQHKRSDGPGMITRARRWTSYWLSYQPRPLPIINRVLPSNSTSLFILFWLGMNVFIHLYRLPLLESKYFFCFADRAGYIFIVNLPLLYLLAAKTQPIKFLTGQSYESLNIFHRRVGEFMCFEALVHTVSMLVWEFVLEPIWLPPGDNDPWGYFTHPIIVNGIIAFIAYEALYFTSLGSFRQRWYELFLASHVTLQVIALVFLYLHFRTARPYALMSLAIFLVDRTIWRLGLKSATLTADLTVLPDSETLVLSANWDKPTSKFGWFPWPRHNTRHGWKPTDHVFLTVPALGRTHALQAHPFTIASAAPPARRNISDDGDHPTHCWLSLLIRAHEGFTSDLLRYAEHHQRVSVRLDGPYGSTHALDMLRAADSAILVAGGSGIAVTFPLVWALLMDDDAHDDRPYGSDFAKRGIERTWRATRPKVHMLWIIHSEEHHSWMPRERLDELVAAGLDLVIPPPTAVAGRPDVAGTVDGWIEEAGAGGGQTAVVVSGPDGLNRMVRNTCSEAVGRGLDVRTAVEKFGW
ncbi:hypothetical protein SLS53_006130 [Cytospora paraplurivora]|uniref:FAD-binding FR-type domain-containing protein n=1 Tax=Cytospora paraplurivora TaxID=2898453 RepID=A0AAN9U5E9_9PEZI